MRVMSGYGQISDANAGLLRDFLGYGSPVTGRVGFCGPEIVWQEPRQTTLEFHPVSIGTPSSPLVPAPELAGPPLTPKSVG
jgi:hypothetical protein